MLKSEHTTAERRTAPDEEQALAAALRQRSEDAWARVFDLHYHHIFRYVFVRTSDADTAKELAAAVFLEGLKSAHTYSYRGRPVLAWLYTIARNVLSAHFKASQRRPAPFAFVFSRRGARTEDERLTPASRVPAAGDASAGIERLDLAAAVQRLPEEQREVLALHYFAGLSLVEVARVLGKPERRTYSIQARAIERLRRELRGEDLSKEAAASGNSGASAT